MLLRPKPSGLASLFGALELRVLEVLWERGDEVSVRDVLPHFPRAAYTTVMTTMERLHRKGVLERRKAGRAFLYRPAQSVERRAIADEIGGLVGIHGFSVTMVSRTRMYNKSP